MKQDKDFNFKKFRIFGCIRNIQHDIEIHRDYFICNTCHYAESLKDGELEQL